MPRLKPKVLRDIQRGQTSVFRAGVHRLNFSYSPAKLLPLTLVLKVAAMLTAAFVLILGRVVAPTTHILEANAVSPPTSDEERKVLENQLKELESQIGQYEDQIGSYKRQGSTLKGEISRLNNQIGKLNLQIRAVNLALNDLDKRIGKTQEEISVTEEDIDKNKTALSDLLFSVYQNDQASLMEIFLKKPKLSDFFGDLQSISLLQENLRVTIMSIIDLRDQLQGEKEQLALARADAEEVRAYQASQKQETDRIKEEKDRLLSITKGQESKYTALLKETKATAAQIRSRIFELLGGGELSFEEALQYAKLASGATGVRPAMILAVLDRESALGKNVGKCSYKTAMSPKNQEIFLQITKELSLDPESMMVSCPNRDGVYGGAMGPAQFIPSTWMLYRDAVARVTGRTLASPWNNSDAFVATALYLRDSMQGCIAVYDNQISQERCAAAKYYAGGRWRSYLWTYGEAVIKRARSFQEDIDTIS